LPWVLKLFSPFAHAAEKSSRLTIASHLEGCRPLGSWLETAFEEVGRIGTVNWAYRASSDVMKSPSPDHSRVMR
jgi:hypothetical protein